jgi:hypothetical protein
MYFKGHDQFEEPMVCSYAHPIGKFSKMAITTSRHSNAWKNVLLLMLLIFFDSMCDVSGKKLLRNSLS